MIADEVIADEVIADEVIADEVIADEGCVLSLHRVIDRIRVCESVSFSCGR